jgi:WD40-like Beta Propeller Repeat
MGKALLVVALALSLPSTGEAASRARILYSSDWSGPQQVYSIAPGASARPAQLTPPLPGFCDPFKTRCGFTGPKPSPDGRKLLFTNAQFCDGPGLYVANADGTVRRRLARLRTCGLFEVAWAPDSRRVAYTLGSSLFTVGADGRGRRYVGNGASPAWSPDGRTLAFRRVDDRGAHELVLDRNGGTRIVASNVAEFAWSPNGRWIALERTTSGPSTASLELVRPDGTGVRRFSGGYVLDLAWSRDGRFLLVRGSGGLSVIEVVTGTTTTILTGGPSSSWSRRGSRLAFDGPQGLSVFDATTGESHLISSDHARELAWRPDDRAVAYVEARSLWPYETGDLRIATTSGHVATLVASSGPYGGRISSIAWATPVGRLRYRAAPVRTVAQTAEAELVAPWPVERIAADGQRVAYVSCGHVFVWTPSRRDVVQAEPAASLTPLCGGGYLVYDLALAGGRVAFGARVGNAGQTWALFQHALAARQTQELARVYGANGCGNGSGGLGNLAGSGDLLVFSRWEDVRRPADTPCAEIVRQDVHRLDSAGCPCPLLATSPGPLLPADVSDERVAVVGRNATLVLDRTGTEIAAAPVPALTAQLDGSSLVLLLPGELREYHAETGVLRHAWTMPKVPSGGECGNPHPLGCDRPQLVLEDVAQGLAAYVHDGQVHLLRLSDGAHAVVAMGRLARFMDDGLVYVDGARVRLLSFAQLPVRGF